MFYFFQREKVTKKSTLEELRREITFNNCRTRSSSREICEMFVIELVYVDVNHCFMILGVSGQNAG